MRRRLPRGSGAQLREEIIAAARELFAAARSVDDVSLRAVAAAVGVTPPSLYRHFADRDELVAAVVVEVFTQLDEEMASAASGIEDPLERGLAFGSAYVRFALAHPESYRLATMDPSAHDSVDEALTHSAWLRFSAVVAECLQAGVFEPPTGLDGEEAVLAITLDLWSAAHGLASLMITKPSLPWGEPAAATERMLRAAATGHMRRP